MQISASGGGECATHSALEKIDQSVAGSFERTTATVEERVAMLGWSEPDFANGCTGGPVRSCDVSQQALFAQQPGAHAFSLGAFERMHEAAGSRATPKKSAATRTIEMVTFLNIILLNSTIRAARRGSEELHRPLQEHQCSDGEPSRTMVATACWSL
jgi:hypothetical protein